MRKSHGWIAGFILAVFASVLFVASASGHTDGTPRVTRALAAASTGVSFRLQGCDLPANVSLPISGKFICPTADYSDGNLGKNWNELDLVPHRILLSAGNSAPATQTYTFQFAVDYSETSGGTLRPGFDFIENGFENVSGGCTATIGPQAIDGVAPANQTAFRVITVTQAKNTTCQLDLYARLAVGAHLFPGSSLHSFLLNDPGTGGIGDTSGIGNKTNSIPVNQIQPQSISKDMAALRNTDHAWTLTKSSNPASIDFGNICAANFTNTKGIGITVTWTKLAATPSGDVTIVTHVYATNPSHRVITTSVSDQWYEGSSQAVAVGAPATATADVPANTANFLLLTHTATVSDPSSSFNDIATGTYVDQVTGIPVPGSTTAAASATVQSGTDSNASASITDSEAISGSGLSFAVGAPSVGAFTGGYVAGTFVAPGPVGWASGVQAGTGSITFNKTIKLNPAQATSGSLTDTATLNGSDGFGPITATLTPVGISSSAAGTLTITKTIPNVLQGSESQTFTFDVMQGAVVIASVPVTFNAGDTSKSVDVSGLPLGGYTVHEESAANWTDQPDQSITLGCAGSLTFHNNFPKATAAADKVTDPAGFQGNWNLILTKPDGTTQTVNTDASGNVSFGQLTQEGNYTVSEQSKLLWSEVGAVGGGGATGGATTCSFSVDYPADQGKNFTCEFTNRARAHATLFKTFEGGPLTGAESFNFQLREGSTINAAGTILESGVANVADNGTINFSTDLIPGGGHSYSVCEVLQPNITPSFGVGISTYNPGGDPTVLCRDIIALAQIVNAVTINVDNTPAPAHADVAKITDPAGNESGFVMTLNGPGTPAGGETVTTTGAGVIPFTTALQDGGVYTITETPKAGWTQTGASADCSFTVHYPADANRTFHCTINNQGRAHIVIHKITMPSGSSQSFSYDTSGTGYAAFNLTDGGTNDQTVAAPGTYAVHEAQLPGWVLTSLTCNNGNGVPDPANGVVHITVPAGGTVDCTYVNTAQAKIVVVKHTNPAGGSGFNFNPSYEPGFSLNDGQSNTSNFLAPGVGYSVSELGKAGWILTSATCDGGNTPASITLAAGQTVTCTFNNTAQGRIIVNKVTDPSPDPSNSLFVFSTSGAGYAGFSLHNGESNDSGFLNAGNYTVAEGAVAGWSLKSATCDSGTPGAITLAPGQTVHCTFTNISRGSLRLVKTLNGGALGTQSFDFSLREGASTSSVGQIDATGTASAANGGIINFAFGLVPGVTYQVCETVVPTYGPNFTGGFGPFNPNGDPGFYCENVGPITVAQAANTPSLTLNVDNSHQFVKALTIGFWKTHAPASCKQGSGKQSDALSPALGSGILLGTYSLTDACKAVQLLSKNNINGVKEPGDPIFNFVAQEVAAKLNVAGGATCPALVTALGQADALLTAINFNGVTYTMVPPLTAAQLTLAGQLNTTLDAFNNNNLC